MPSQNLPVASHSRRKNTVQMESRAQRLLKRSAKLSPDSSKGDGVVVEKPKDSQTLQVPKVTQCSPITRIKTEPNLDTSIAKKPDVRIAKTKNTAPVVGNSSLASRLNVMDFLTTRSKLNAWTGIQTFFLLNKIEDRIANSSDNRGRE